MGVFRKVKSAYKEVLDDAYDSKVEHLKECQELARASKMILLYFSELWVITRGISLDFLAPLGMLERHHKTPGYHFG